MHNTDIQYHRGIETSDCLEQLILNNGNNTTIASSGR